MTITLLNPASSSWVFSTNPATNPCSCCDAPRAMDHLDGYWHCDQENRTWLVLDDAFDATVTHSIEQCLGNCPQHPLVDSLLFSMSHADAFNIAWGDIVLADELAALARETPEERAARLEEEAILGAARQLAAKATEMERYARLKAQTNTEVIKLDRGKKITRIRKMQEPCKWLYLDEKAPKTEWRRNRDGKMEPPYRLYLTGAECWAFEYHDPKTGKLQVKHTCDHLHPGEEGWQAAWAKDRFWREPGSHTGGWHSHSHTPTKHFDTASTVSTTSAVSARSFRSAPAAQRKFPVHSTSTSTRKINTRGGFSALMSDDSD